MTHGPTPPVPGTPIPSPAGAGDDGSADARLVAALASGDRATVHGALRQARLLVAVVAVPGEQQASEGEMALALIESPSGARALPAFTSLAAFAAWQPAGRPVPRPAAAVLAHVRAEGLAALVLDPAGPHPWTLAAAEVALLLGHEPAASETVDSDAVLSSPSWRPGRRLRLALAGLDAWALDVGGEPVVAVVPGAETDLGGLDDLATRVAEAAGRRVDLLILDAERGQIVDGIGRRLGTSQH